MDLGQDLEGFFFFASVDQETWALRYEEDEEDLDGTGCELHNSRNSPRPVVVDSSSTVGQPC